MPGTIISSAQVGLKKLYYAVLSKDDSTGATYGTPKPIAGVISAKVTTQSSTETLFADNGPAETATAIGQTDFEVETKDIPFEIQAELLGHTIGADGTISKSTNDKAPYVAVGFVSDKANGKNRYVWLFKGKFTVPDQSYQTSSDKVQFQTSSIKGTFIRRDFDQKYMIMGDEDLTGFTSGATWFNQVGPVV